MKILKQDFLPLPHQQSDPRPCVYSVPIRGTNALSTVRKQLSRLLPGPRREEAWIPVMCPPSRQPLLTVKYYLHRLLAVFEIYVICYYDL